MSGTFFEDDESSRILIIDDNPRIHRDFELVLLEEPENAELAADEERLYGTAVSKVSRPAYILEHAQSGLEGIEKTKSANAAGRPYQLAFVDIRMPGLDGVETVAQIWQFDPKIQIVICTAFADYSQEDLIRKLGQTDKLLVLKKPFDSIEVTQMARTLTQKWHLARQATLKLEQMELLVARRTQKLMELQPLTANMEADKSADATVPTKKLPLILLVENDFNARSRLKQIFGEEYEIIDAADVTTGLAQARELVPDMVIARHAPPGFNGIEFCSRLKSDPLTAHIPVVLIAEAGAKENQLSALEAGADDFQPFNLPLLKARVENLLESRRKLRAGFNPGTTLQPRDLAVNQADAKFLQRAIAVIEQNLADYEFDVDALAQSVAVSRRQLFRKLKAVLDTTPNMFIRSVRLKRAAQLLTESEMTVTSITFAVGFLDVKHFRNLFKEQFGLLPSEYIKQHGLTTATKRDA